MSDDTPYTRISFNDLFKKLLNGNLFLKKKLIVSGEEFGPGIEIKPGELLGGVDFHKRQGFDLAITTDTPDTYVLRGFYLDTE